jgi:hypothetical protein
MTYEPQSACCVDGTGIQRSAVPVAGNGLGDWEFLPAKPQKQWHPLRAALAHLLEGGVPRISWTPLRRHKHLGGVSPEEFVMAAKQR